MANYKLLIPFIKDAEGGLSADSKDSSSKNPSPCLNNNGVAYHTNKGITWATFTGLSKKLGYATTCYNFLKMPDEIWAKIYKNGYWDAVKGDQIKNQAIANTFAEMTWGSGFGCATCKSGTLPFLKQFFKKHYNKDFSNIDQIVDFVNEIESKGKTSILFELLNNFRAEKYKNMNQPNFLRGWLNRLNKFYILNKPYAMSFLEKTATMGLFTGLLLIAAGGAYIYVRNRRK
jgi:lysozyme family protein